MAEGTEFFLFLSVFSVSSVVKFLFFVSGFN